MVNSKLVPIDELKRLYLDELWSKKELCEKYNITYGSLNYLLYQYRLTKTHKEPRVHSISKEDLYRALYIDKLTNFEIMQKFNICEQTLRKLIDYYSIPRRWDYSEWEDECIQLYVDERKSLTQIASILEIPKSRARKILINAGIKLRSKSESQLTAHYSPNIKWYDISPLQKRCRSYFGNNLASKYKDTKCAICGATEHLCVHHIVPFAIIVRKIIGEHRYLNLNSSEGIDKMYEIIINDKRFLDPLNLITVCEYCHYNVFHKNLLDLGNQQPSS